MDSENPSNTLFSTKGGGPQGYISDRTLEDGSFLRLKTLELSYGFPQRLLRKAKVFRSISVNFAAQNLFTWTNYSGLDPEVSTMNSVLTPGFDFCAYPRAPRIYIRFPSKILISRIMRHNKSYMPLLAVVLCTVSCSDFLDTKPRGTLYPDTYYTTEANLEAALTGIYSNLGNSNLYGNNFVSQLGNDADESYYFRSTYTYGPVIYNHTSSSANIANLWQILYNGIGRANMLLYRMPDAVDVDKAVKDRYKGRGSVPEGIFLFPPCGEFRCGAP